MRARRIIGGLVASALLLLPRPSAAELQLSPVVSGLSSPLFVGNAGDGSQRLFILEQAGIIKVLPLGSTTPTVFLDIRSKVTGGGERGLLGLAFHPTYSTNRRFFVFYTRVADGALTIAEYTTFSGTPNAADPNSERVFLTIAHPAGNHNGGMMAFGPDGFLYIGVGDGGGSNDQDNNAQNIDRLLGKILRIDIDHPESDQKLYTSPSSNPFANGAGADEIFAYGFRNPWRFSFDRQTNQQWVGDVGQGAREEVDTPIERGGNYGWRIWEGNLCSTTNDPGLCNPTTNFYFPILDYDHSNNRCSITGGYVYRGGDGTLPLGNYVYGDYCSGDIWVWDGGAHPAVLNIGFGLSSFGQDEQGELYVVNISVGSISKLVSTTPICTYGISPSSQSFPSAGGTGNVTVTATTGCAWTAVANDSWIQVTSGASGSGNGNVGYSVDANTSGSSRSGSMTIAGKTFAVTQSAASCSYSISPTKNPFAASGGTGTVSVTATAGCSWTAVSNASWITVTAGASGMGNGTVSYSVGVYTGRPRNRNGTITIAGLTFSIKQSR